VDFAHVVDVDGFDWRFRVNILQQQGHLGMVARRVNRFIPDFAKLNLPPIIEDLCKFDQGMVLLAGVTGSGKSTTIASMLNWINAHYRKHILTLEDPIEFTFTEDKCLINQREIGIDVKNFEIGMKHAVREDPDVMLVGEMRDRETFLTAIQAAETGHLVFGTIHSSTAPSTIGRILDLFENSMHPALRSAIAFNMRAIVAQKLLPSIKPGVGRVPTVEIMTFSPSVKKLILEERDEKLGDLIRMSAKEGMQDFTISLKDLVDRDLIDRAVALEVAPNVEALKMALKGIDVSQPGIL
jgi:twitching motility protein PilT